MMPMLLTRVSGPAEADEPVLVGEGAPQGGKHGLGLSHDYDAAARPCDRRVEPARVEQAGLRHSHDDMVGFRALRAMAGQGVAQRQIHQVLRREDVLLGVEDGQQAALIAIDAPDRAERPVEKTSLIVVDRVQQRLSGREPVSERPAKLLQIARTQVLGKRSFSPI